MQNRRLFAFGEWVHVRTRLNEALVFIQGHRLLCGKLLAAALLCFCAPNTNRISEKSVFTARDAVFSGILLSLSLFFMTRVSTFLYFNF